MSLENIFFKKQDAVPQATNHRAVTFYFIAEPVTDNKGTENA